MTLPELPPSFRWTQESWGLGLRCRPLEAVAPHVFATRQLVLSDPEGYRRLAVTIGAERSAVLTQVHGRAVVVVRDTDQLSDARPEADALVSNSAAAALVVRAADCVPLLLADRRTGAVAAVHAGWRGTAAKVTTAAVGALQAEFGAHPVDLVAAIGPAIGPCCYEVGPELVDAFAAAGHERHLIDRWFQVRRDGKLRLDVPGANRDQLILAGVPEDQIHLAGLCTAMQLDILTSYRAEKEQAGRLAAAIRARA
jgi:YfiH family protein